MTKFALPSLAACLVLFQTSSAQEFTISLYGRNFNGCDVTDLFPTPCDPKVFIKCQRNFGSWVDCGTGREMRDDNNPNWPELHTYNYVASERMRWNFEIIDNDPFIDDHIHTFQLDVVDFLEATGVGTAYRHDMAGRGIFYIHLNQMTTTTTPPSPSTSTTTMGPSSSTTMDPQLFTCTGRLDGFYPNPLDCSKYIGCYEGEMSHYQCPSPLLFDPTIGGCNLPSLVDCDMSCEGKLDGLYPHPQDCSLYIICNDWELYVSRCPAPLLFNRVERRCDFPQNVECPTGGIKV